jgi:hypothetical protein
MKTILTVALFLLAITAVDAQKSVIDSFLEQNPEIAQQATCVNISDEMLRMCYETSSLTPPEHYQSISLCNARPSTVERFEKNDLFKNYSQLMEIKKDDGRLIRYFQQTQNKKGTTKREIVVCTQYRNDFSVIYLKGDDLSINTLNTHLELIRSFIDKNKNINTYH